MTMEPFAINEPSPNAGPAEDDVSVFLCYRQVDGAEAANWLYQHLNGLEFDSLQHKRKLSVYLDVGAPATGDWKAIHQPSLERARAFVYLATPGALSKMSEDDWVHKELSWWILNRKTAPVIVDTTGEGERWLPEPLREKWPNCQRVVFRPSTWSTEEEATNTERLVRQIVEGIRLSETGVLFEDVEEHKRLLRRSRAVLVSVAFFAILATIGMGLTLWLNEQLARSNEKLDAAVLSAERASQQAGEAYRRADSSAKAQQAAALEFLDQVIGIQKEQLRDRRHEHWLMEKKGRRPDLLKPEEWSQLLQEMARTEARMGQMEKQLAKLEALRLQLGGGLNGATATRGAKSAR